jgi:hypothetical protein
MTIVRTVYRPKRAPRRKAQPAAGTIPTIVRSISRKAAKLEALRTRQPAARAKPE